MNSSVKNHVDDKIKEVLWASEELELPMNEEYYEQLHDRIMAEISKREILVGRESHVPWRPENSENTENTEEKGS